MTDDNDKIDWAFEEKLDWFLGVVFGGRHHVKSVEHKHNHYLVKLFESSLATYDGNRIMRIAFASADVGLRIEIEPNGMRGLRLMIHNRTKREGSLCERIPTLDQQLARYREFA